MKTASFAAMEYVFIIAGLLVICGLVYAPHKFDALETLQLWALSCTSVAVGGFVRKRYRMQVEKELLARYGIEEQRGAR